MVLKLHCYNLFKTFYEELYIGLNSKAIQKEQHCRVQSKGINLDFNKLHNSMERLVEKHRKESIKNTVMKHEEIFKQQVEELHRLYEVQKKLMSEVGNKELKLNNSFFATSNPHAITDRKNRFRNSKSTSETSHGSHASVLNHSPDLPYSEHTSTQRFFAGKSSRELSNFFTEPLRISKEYNFHQSIEGESHESCSNLDLTLGMNNKTGWKQMANDSSLLLSSNLNKSDRVQEFTSSDGRFGSESLKRPHWLFQALNLNRT